MPLVCLTPSPPLLTPQSEEEAPDLSRVSKYAYVPGRPLSPAALRAPNLHHFNLDPSSAPAPGTEIELRDLDFTWCPCVVIKNWKTKIKVRYIGWSSEWDETLPYPHSRLARMYTYTKRVKCWVRQGNTDTRFPAVVRLRNPQPGSRHAEEALAMESKVYVEYFHPGPRVMKQKNEEKGEWVNTRNVTGWSSYGGNRVLDDAKKSQDGNLGTKNSIADALKRLESSIRTAVNPAAAVNESLGGGGSIGKLPRRAFERGSLLRREYRVLVGGGEVVNGFTFTGEIKESESSQRKAATKQPSSEPIAVPISWGCYDRGVQRIEETGLYMSVVELGGNRYNLGLYDTATEAKIRTENGRRIMEARLNEGTGEDVKESTYEEVVSELLNMDERENSYTPLKGFVNGLLNNPMVKEGVDDAGRSVANVANEVGMALPNGYLFSLSAHAFKEGNRDQGVGVKVISSRDMRRSRRGDEEEEVQETIEKPMKKKKEEGRKKRRKTPQKIEFDVVRCSMDTSRDV